MLEALRTGPLAGRVAVVSGGGRGLGRSFCLALARQGAMVVVNNRNRVVDADGHGPADHVADQITAAGGEAVTEYSDAADPGAGQAMVAAALRRWGRLDICVANAAIGVGGMFHKQPSEGCPAERRVHRHRRRPAAAGVRGGVGHGAATGRSRPSRRGAGNSAGAKSRWRAERVPGLGRRVRRPDGRRVPVSWGPLLVNLAVTAGIVAVLMLATFFYAMRTRVHTIMDTVWPLGFVIIALVSFGLSAGSGDGGRRVLVLLLTAAWGLRLGTHIFARNRGQGEDKRYASLLRRNRGSLAAFVLRYIYWPQGRVMWFVSLPVQVAMYERAGLSGVTWLGVALWAVGFGFETVGDAQLSRFRADPANAGRVLDRGLWRYTRHPNYFGDAVVWFGLWLLACSHWLGLLVVISPVYMTNMLVRHTGKKLLEKHMARSKGAAYADYVRRTSGFIPWPPR